VRFSEHLDESDGTRLTRGYAAALAAAAILSTTAIFIRYLTQSYRMPPLVLAFWRDGLVTLTLLSLLALLKPVLIRVKLRHLVYLLCYGLTLAIFNGLWTLSVFLAGAALATVLVYSSAGFTAILGWWLLKERLDWSKLLAVAACLGGCFLVSGVLDQGAWSANLMGVLAGTLSGLCYAVYSLMGRSASQRGLSAWTTVLYTFGFAAFFLLLFNLLPDGLLSGFDTGVSNLLWLGGALGGWAILFVLAAGPTLAGYGLHMVSLGYLPSSVANLVLTVEPVFTAALAYVLLGERLSAWQIGGSLMILTGVAFLRTQEGRLVR
jgi:drug/metabolite transporter (DMT)-like permease